MDSINKRLVNKLEIQFVSSFQMIMWILQQCFDDSHRFHYTRLSKQSLRISQIINDSILLSFFVIIVQLLTLLHCSMWNTSWPNDFFFFCLYALLKTQAAAVNNKIDQSSHLYICIRLRPLTKKKKKINFY